MTSLAVRQARQLAELRQQVEEMRTALANVVRVGTVEEVDATKGYRLKFGDGPDGKPYLSPFLPHPETGKTSVPLKKGQIVGHVSPNGDPRQGFLLRAGYGGDHQSPNADMDANVFDDAGVRVEISSGALRITAGGVTVEISGGGLKIDGGQVVHNDRNIGASHVHPGIQRGGAKTDPPE